MKLLQDCPLQDMRLESHIDLMGVDEGFIQGYGFSFPWASFWEGSPMVLYQKLLKWTIIANKKNKNIYSN